MAQGSIRIRCKICRKAGVKEGECKHKEQVFNALFPAPDGGQISSTFRTKGDAQKWLAKTATDVNEGTYRSIKPKTVKEITEQYLASFRGNVRPASFTAYGYYVDRINAAFGDYPISKVSLKMINDLTATRDNAGFSERQKLQRHLKGVFLAAEQQGAIKQNPMRYMKGVRNIKKRKPYTILDATRIQQLIDIAEDPMTKLYYKMAVYTGMRPNELCGLSRAAINLDKHEIRVEQTMYWFKTQEERGNHSEPFIIQECKTQAAYRILPIGKELFADLQIYLISAPENPHNFLFARGNGQPLSHVRDIMKQGAATFDRGCFPVHLKKLKEDFEFPDITFYEIRHTYASMLFQMGINLKKVQYLMGHEDFETTANIYARIFGKNISEDSEFRSVADKMEEFVAQSK